MLTDSCYFVVMVCPSHTFDLLFCDYLFLIYSWVQLTSSNWRSAFCRAGLVGKHFLNLVFIMNCSPFPAPASFIVIDSFARYSILSCHLCSLRVCRISIQALLAFRVFTEKSDVILMGLPLYVTWSLFLAVQSTWCCVCFLYLDGNLLL
jgi:hypothetical protein